MEEFDQWSDDLLDELSRLGEGASGAVYKVRDRRTGLIMARKTITTLEAPMKQLLREIKITSSTSHVNIIHFYGAYISPSSSEVKVLMECCDGGSLESVGKRMKEIGGRVGEKVAGRLAEGVRFVLVFIWPLSPTICAPFFFRSFKDLTISMPKRLSTEISSRLISSSHVRVL